MFDDRLEIGDPRLQPRSRRRPSRTARTRARRSGSRSRSRRGRPGSAATRGSASRAAGGSANRSRSPAGDPTRAARKRSARHRPTGRTSAPAMAAPFHDRRLARLDRSTARVKEAGPPAAQLRLPARGQRARPWFWWLSELCERRHGVSPGARNGLASQVAACCSARARTSPLSWSQSHVGVPQCDLHAERPCPRRLNSDPLAAGVDSPAQAHELDLEVQTGASCHGRACRAVPRLPERA